MLYYNLAIFCIAYYVYIAIHRLLLSPISKFPGPRLAALTWWYEFYYDVIKNGQFYKEIERMHSIYGPIVRINPSEVHIKDPTWYSELNASAPRIRDRPSWYPTPIADGSTASTVQHALHRHRRAALSPFFSKAGVTSFSSLILSRVDLLCARFAEKAGTGAVMHLNMVFTALTLDVISYYSFGDAMGLLEDGEFKVAQEWKKMFEQVTQAGVFMRHFPLVPRVVNSLPYRLVMFLFPSIASFKRFETAVRHKTTMTLSNSDVGTAQSSKSTQRTIFEELRDSDLPPEEKSISRLTAEALTLIGAGSETTATTLATLTFHLLSTPRVLQKLTAELDAAIPDVRSPPPLQELEQLPYLRATIVEAHRITSIVTGRLIRIAPAESLHYGQWVIPPNTPVSMSTYWMHLDASIFPSPSSFQPERFIEQDGKENERYVIPFSKGTRACVGMNLANAELVLTVALLFRRFELALFQTDESDVRFEHDLLTGGTRLGSKGVRVRILGERA